MFKPDLVDAVIASSKKGDFKSHAAAERAVNSVFNIIKDQVAKGESVSISGFGTFKSVDREARVYKNMTTGEDIYVDAHKAPKFQPSKKFKDML